MPGNDSQLLSPATMPESSLIDAAVGHLSGRRIAVMTGAGISTDSGIPDYRGAGAPVRTPMTFTQFVRDASAHKRYWAGSHLGWAKFAAAEPNRGHVALARLESSGLASGILTQNVDGLHSRAGSERVVELHGTMHRVLCLMCGQTFSRRAVAEAMALTNPVLAEPDAVALGPDGDVDISRLGDVAVPTCTVCGGMLKPDIVFFGEFIPVQTFAQASSIIRTADALLIAGSSLVVNSGIRLLEQATRRRLPVVIVNRGETKGDSRAAVKIDAGTSETLTALAERLTG